MLLADCTDTGALRGYARADAGRARRRCCATTRRRRPMQLLGGGYLAFTVDQGPDTEPPPGHRHHRGRQPGRDGAALFPHQRAACAASSISPASSTEAGWRAGALILEKIAGAGGIDPDAGRRGAGGKLAHRDHARRHADRRRTAGRQPAAGAAALPAVPQRRRRHRPAARAVLRLPLLARAAGRHPRRLPDRRPRSHGGGRRHRHDLRVLQLRLPLSRARTCTAAAPHRRACRALSRRSSLLLPLAARRVRRRRRERDSPPLRYNYLTPLRLNVAAIQIEQRFVPSGAAPDVSQLDPMPPVQALRNMAEDRLQALGSCRPGGVRHPECVAGATARHDHRQPVGASSSIYPTPNTRAGFAQASVSGSYTGDLDDLPARLYDMTKSMMDRMNVEFEYQVRRSLGAWLLHRRRATGAGAATAVDRDAAPDRALTQSAGIAIPETIPRDDWRRRPCRRAFRGAPSRAHLS